jgi:hypothetical protein
LHYPSLLVSSDHKLVTPLIQGYKSRAAYVALVSDLLHLPWKESFVFSGAIDLPRPMSHFFKPVYGTDFIVSASAYPNHYLFNLKTRDTYEIPKSNFLGDPGASPTASLSRSSGAGD